MFDNLKHNFLKNTNEIVVEIDITLQSEPMQ